MLITVKAYPNPSHNLGEAACTAGISRQRGLVRLYPIPFRDLEDDLKFKKYQWARVEVSPPRQDPRAETFRPRLDTLEIISEPVSTANGWRARRELVLPHASASLCDIQESQKQSGTSLGLFKPAEVIDFDWEPEDPPGWTPAERARLEQKDLFMTRNNKLLEKIPYTFRYRFRCQDCRAKEPHHVKVIDWELMQLYRNLRVSTNSIEECLGKVRDRWLSELCGPERDTYFFTGNMQRFPKSFLVLGVFWPPMEKQLHLI